jgi:hypothetical protein
MRNIICASVRAGNLVCYCERGLAAVQSVSRQPFTAEVRVRSHFSPHGDRGAKEIYYEES